MKTKTEITAMALKITHHNNLTPASRQVVDLLFHGVTSNKALSAALGLSQKSVQSRVDRAFWQLALPFGTHRTQAIVLMLQRGLVVVEHVAEKAARTAAALLLALLTLHGAAVGSADMARLSRARAGRTVKTTRRDGAPFNPLEGFEL